MGEEEEGTSGWGGGGVVVVVVVEVEDVVAIVEDDTGLIEGGKCGFGGGGEKESSLVVSRATTGVAAAGAACTAGTPATAAIFVDAGVAAVGLEDADGVMAVEKTLGSRWAMAVRVSATAVLLAERWKIKGCFWRKAIWSTSERAKGRKSLISLKTTPKTCLTEMGSRSGPP